MKNLKRIAALALACCMTFGGIANTVQAEQKNPVLLAGENENTTVEAAQDPKGLEINKTNFTTKKLRKWAKSLDKDGNGWLSMEEGSSVREFKDSEGVLDESPVVKTYSAEYLKLLPNLEKICLKGIAVNRLDFSGNPKLKEIEIKGCDILDEIDLSKNRNLEVYFSTLCNFVRLDFSGCPKIKEVISSGDHTVQKMVFSKNRELTKVWYDTASNGEIYGLSELPELKELHCEEVDKIDADFNSLKKLKELTLNNVNIKALELQNLKYLKTVKIDHCPLTDASIKNLPNLRNLTIEMCRLKTLEISGCKNLKTLNCSTNKLKELKLGTARNLQSLYCSWNKIASLDVSKCRQLKNFSCVKNRMEKLVVSKKKINYFSYKYGNKIKKVIRK